MKAAQKKVTYEDLVALPDDVVGQIVGGELVVSPRPNTGHALVAGRLIGEIDSPFGRGRGGPGGWWILPEPELHLDEDVLVPDLAGWRRERLPDLPLAPFLTVAPDWVCEILSPSTASVDRIRKLPSYARGGVTHAWLVDPGARTLEAFRRDGDRWLLIAGHRDDERPRVEPFEAIELEMNGWWLPEADESST